MADNSYPIEIKLGSAAGYFTKAQADAYYRKDCQRLGVTYHWWNSPDKIADRDHDNIVNMFLRNFAAGAAPTVNYVVSAAKLTLMASPDHITWTSNNGNATTIGVEVSPHFNETIYKKLGWLHDQLEQRYNRTLALYRHNDWTSTACSPISTSEIRRWADWWKAQRNVPAPTPAPTPVPPTVTVQVQDIKNKQVRVTKDTQLWDLGFTKWSDAKSVKPLPAGTVLEASAIAKHPLGGEYYLTEYSFAKGIKNGFNVKDCEDYTDPIAPVTPAPTPVVPKPVPVEVPLTVEERVGKIEGFLKTLGFK